MSGSQGMSSELQAIMQRRLARCDESGGNDNSDSHEDQNDDQTPMKSPPAWMKTKPTTNAPSTLKLIKKIQGVKSGDSPNIENDSDNLTEFQRNIAKFNQKKKTYTGTSMSTPNSRRSPVPFDEARTPTYSTPRNISTPRTFSHNSTDVHTTKTYSLRPSSVPRSYRPVDKFSSSNDTPTPNKSQYSTGMDMLEKKSNQQFRNRSIPSLIVTDSEPPPPPPPGKNSSSPKAKTPKKESPSKKSPLPLSHVQAMKKKFLFTNPQPIIPKASTPSNAEQSSSSSKTRSVSSKRLDALRHDMDDLTIERKNNVSEGLYVGYNAGDEEFNGTKPKNGDEAKNEDNDSVNSREPNDDNLSVRSSTSSSSSSNANLFDEFGVKLSEPNNLTTYNEFEHREKANAEDTSNFPTFDVDFAPQNFNDNKMSVENATDQNTDWNWNPDMFASATHNVENENGGDHLMRLATSESEEDGYEPPPFSFAEEALFVPKPEHFEDDDDQETLWDGDGSTPKLLDEGMKTSNVYDFSEEDASFSCRNPFNGNTVLCYKRKKIWCIEEVCALGIRHSSIDIAASDINMMVDEFIVCGVKEVKSVQCGLQFENGQPKVKVAVVFSLYPLTTASNKNFIGVWDWSLLGSEPCKLFGVLALPGHELHYNLSTLCIGHDYLILVGAESDSQSLVVANISGDQNWHKHVLSFDSDKVSNPIRPTQIKIHPREKIIAIVDDNNDVSIWNLSEDGQVKLINFLMNRIDLNEDRGSKIDIEWIPYNLCPSLLPFLAVAKPDHLSIYCIDPGKKVTELLPITTKIFDDKSLKGGERLLVRWMKGGDNVFPFLSVMKLAKDQSFIVILGTDFGEDTYSLKYIHQEDGLSFGDDVFDFLSSKDEGRLILHRSGGLASLTLSSSSFAANTNFRNNHAKLTFIPDVICSEALGLTNTGSVYGSFHDIYFIKSIVSSYARKHVLFCTSTGDNNENRPDSEDEFPKGGTAVSRVCELNSSGQPLRIDRHEGGEHILVLYGSRCNASISEFSVISNISKNISQSRSFSAKDAFFTKDSLNMHDPRIIVLGEDSRTLYYCNFLTLEEDLYNENNCLRIFKEGSSNDEKLSVSRVFPLRDKVMFLCNRNFDGKECLFVGGDVHRFNQEGALAFVQKKTKKFWFEKCESLVSIVTLPAHDELIQTTLAIVTTSRIIILICNSNCLQLLAEFHTKEKCHNVVPLGSHTVAFQLEIDSTLYYLSAGHKPSVGIVCNLPSLDLHGLSRVLAIRPDRLVYLPTTALNRFSQHEEDEPYAIPLVFTKPLLLLEPLLFNVCGSTVESSQNQIQSLMQKFGPKDSNTPYSENEGVGVLGAGINCSVMQVLNTNNVSLKKDFAPWIPSSLRKGKENEIEVGGHTDCHVWRTGPNGNQEELLLLDNTDDWFGKECPSILGKIGAELAQETGEQALQNILAAAAADENSVSSGEGERNDGSWIPNIGEGRKDEDNVSLYLRFSDEKIGEKWRTDGIQDLSKHRNIVQLSSPSSFTIEESTSNVDEGEPGKIHPLGDLVCVSTSPSPYMKIDFLRGSALDVGMFHSDRHASRQRSTLEFWFYVPNIESEIVLARRSIPQGAGIENDQMIWELVVLSTGFLEFRTNAGSSIISKPKDQPEKLHHDFSSDKNERIHGLISMPSSSGFGGWNHICLSFSCSGLEYNNVGVTLRMNGSFVATEQASIGVLQSDIDAMLAKSYLIFGLHAMEGFRMTEIRVWACRRSSEDIKMMMYEHLDIARMKKKFKVSIRTKGAQIGTSKSALTLPSKIAKEKSKPDRPPLQPSGSAHRTSLKEELSQGIDSSTVTSFADFGSIASSDIVEDIEDNTEENQNPYIKEFLEREDTINIPSELKAAPSDEFLGTVMKTTAAETKEPIKTFVNIILGDLISKTIRKSASAAVMRGPPATLTFGGARGALSFAPKTSAYGNICITGSEKTLIFSPSDVPSAKTYPIGSSGAIISDKIDDTEYLCCFLAKEKRIVVFDLKSKTIVVELQMTTKLNFWRFLPPQADSGSLVYLLITPVGGFHWKPLDSAPRPRQIWSRGSALQGKKIINYEEGGSNGLPVPDCKSRVALVLATTTSSESNPVEAWCLSVGDGLKPLCLSDDIQAAALLNHENYSDKNFLPHVAVVELDENGDSFLSVHTLYTDQERETIERENILTSIQIPSNSDSNKYSPSCQLAMGDKPDSICLGYKNFIVVLHRSSGAFTIFTFSGEELEQIHSDSLHRFVVDAAIKQKTENGVFELVALLSKENEKDGYLCKITVDIGTES